MIFEIMGDFRNSKIIFDEVLLTVITFTSRKSGKKFIIGTDVDDCLHQFFLFLLFLVYPVFACLLELNEELSMN